MKDLKKKYIQILKIELEDLHNDIDMYMEQMQNDAQCGEITNYVFRENLALLNNETVGIEIINEYLDTLNLDEFEDINALMQKIKSDLLEKLEKDGIAHALFIYLERKLDKVSLYVSQTA
ncbi:MAG: hypothetical protein JW982_00990 [Spirochaetes bacterium]|nr:hypothetical protein [Spirochaetota bacterium]